jgi:hypothetical protein
LGSRCEARFYFSSISSVTWVVGPDAHFRGGRKQRLPRRSRSTLLVGNVNKRIEGKPEFVVLEEVAVLDESFIFETRECGRSTTFGDLQLGDAAADAPAKQARHILRWRAR